MSGLAVHRAPGYGFRRPKHAVRGTDVAGVVEAVGAGVTQFKPGDEVFGGANGSFAEYARAARTLWRQKPANLTFEQAAAVPMAGLVALQAAPRPRQGPGRSEGPDQRGVRRHRHVRRADREGAGRPRDRRDQHEEPRARPVDRRRRGHRLHARTTSPTSGRQYDFILDNVANHSLSAAPSRAHPDRDARPERWRVQPSLDRQAGGRPVRAACCSVFGRQQANFLMSTKTRRPGRPQGPHRGRQGDAGHGQGLRAEPDPRHRARQWWPRGARSRSR